MEKCTEEIKVRVTPEMRELINALAVAQDRAPSELVRHILARYLWGHATTVAQGREKGEGPNVP